MNHHFADFGVLRVSVLKWNEIEADRLHNFYINTYTFSFPSIFALIYKETREALVLFRKSMDL